MYDIENFVQRTIALLAAQFQGGLANGNMTNFQNLLAAMVSEASDVNSVELQLSNDRYLATAVGVQLDLIGQILGLSRLPNQPDDDEIVDGKAVTGYRTYLYNQVIRNQSMGTPEEMINALSFATAHKPIVEGQKMPYIQYIEPGPAFYQMSTNAPFTDFSLPPQEISSFISSISPAGVEYVPITCTNGVDFVFVFSTDPLIAPLYVQPNIIGPGALVPFAVQYLSSTTPFGVQTGQHLNTQGGGFAEDGYYIPNAGHLAEVLIINGNIPPPY